MFKPMNKTQFSSRARGAKIFALVSLLSLELVSSSYELFNNTVWPISCHGQIVCQDITSSCEGGSADNLAAC